MTALTQGSLADYLARAEFPRGPTALLACELCGSTGTHILRETVVVRGAERAPLRVAGCPACGLLFQVDRFDAAAYARYYAEHYRPLISGAAEPDESFLQDQLRRGDHLYQRLAPLLPRTGRVLDVGCGAGGVLSAFDRHGWETHGMDPDHRAVDLGRRRYGLTLEAGTAEEMVLADDSFDLIVITGSLEHVADIHLVTSTCARALRPGGQILLEGWGLAQARLMGGFGHNQKRYFTSTSFQWLLRHHGLSIECITAEALSGPTRPHSLFAFGRKGPIPPHASLASFAPIEPVAHTLNQDDLNSLGIY